MQYSQHVLLLPSVTISRVGKGLSFTAEKWPPFLHPKHKQQWEYLKHRLIHEKATFFHYWYP